MSRFIASLTRAQRMAVAIGIIALMPAMFVGWYHASHWIIERSLIVEIFPPVAGASVVLPETTPVVESTLPWVEATDGTGDLVVTTLVGDKNGLWTSTRADSSAENKVMWQGIKSYNEGRGMTEYDFRHMIPGKSTYRVPPWWVEEFKSWYWTHASVSPATTTTPTPVDPAQPKTIPGILLGALLGLAVAGGAAVANGQRKRMLRPSDVNPMRTTPIASAEDAANEVREQVLALTRLQPGSPDALPNPSDWTIVSAVRGLGNGAVEAHFNDGSTRREVFTNEPCYEVRARNSAGEERVFHIRIRCANQLTGLRDQFLLPDFRFTPTTDPVLMNVPFVEPPVPPPAPEPAPPAPAAEETPAPAEPTTAEPRSITIERGEGNTLTVTTPTGTATVESSDPIAISAAGGPVTVTIGDQVFTTQAPTA